MRLFTCKGRQAPAKPCTRGRSASFLGPHYLVTVNTGGAASIPRLRERCLKHQQIFERGSDFLLYTLLDELVDLYFPVLETLDGEMDELESRIVANPDSQVLGADPRYQAAADHAAQAVRAAARGCADPDHAQFPAYTGCDHSVSARRFPTICFRIFRNRSKTSRDLVSNTLDAYLSQVNNQMGRVMQRLTSFSTVFMPLSFITGLFGMNFTHQPWADTSVWLWFTVMAVIGVAMAVWFHRHKWV